MKIVIILTHFRVYFFRAISYLAFVLIVVLSLFVSTTKNLEKTSAQIQDEQSTIRVMTFNVIHNAYSNRDGGGDRAKTCPPLRLQYQIEQAQFGAAYMSEQKIAIGMFQEMYAVCPEVAYIQDSLGRKIVDPSKIPNFATFTTINNFKMWFKANYSFQGAAGASMSDLEFEKELERVLGKERFEDVWIRFLPFDTTFWMTMIVTFVYDYPMQVTTKPFAADAQEMRVATFSTFPYYRPVNYAKNADMIPFPKKGERDPNFSPQASTRWAVNAPLDTPFGPLNAYNAHPRGEDSCTNIPLLFKFGEEQKPSNGLYIFGGDFNANIKGNSCDDGKFRLFNDNTLDVYQIVNLDLIGISKVDNLVIKKNESFSFDENSLVLVENNPPSDHKGFSYNLVGPQIQVAKPLTSISLPDYRQPKAYGYPNTQIPSPPISLIVLPIPPRKPEDLDANSVIDIFDYNILLGKFGATGAPGFHTADIIQNGAVDIYDYNKFIESFGK